MTTQLALLIITLIETICIIIIGRIALKAFNEVKNLEMKFSILMEYIQQLDNKVEILWDEEKELNRKPFV